MPRDPVRTFVGIGANLGEAAATVRLAMQQLGQLPDTVCIGNSSLYRSAPLDAGGPDFVNAAALLNTSLAPLELLHHLQRIEAQFGRTRSERNAPRTLDLDLLLHGRTELISGELVLPHPRLHLRAFVLLPLAELEPGLEVPGLGSIGPWLARAAGQHIERLDPG